MDITVTNLKKEDINEIFEIEKLCFDSPWSENLFYEELENKNSHFYVAKINNEIVGFAGILIICEDANILNIAVTPKHQRKGIASKLLKTLIDLAYEKKADFIFLEVRESNISAQNLYEKHGFKVIGRRNKYYDHKEDALIMSIC